MRWLLLFFGRAFRDFGFALFSLPREGPTTPESTVCPGHPEKVVPLSALPEPEQRWWRELEQRLGQDGEGGRRR
jgi:hypothetical protein